MTLLAVGSALLAAVRRHFVPAVVFVAIPYAATVSCTLIKDWVARERPQFACASVDASGFSFPSGHAVGVTTGFLLAAVSVTAFVGHRHSTAILLLAMSLAELVSWSRVLLGVHHAVDVLAGQLFSGGWLALAALLLTRRRTPRPWLPPLGNEGSARARGPSVP
ncbi:phosphatase PAP2 family protein [Streptomyces niger]|uniref:phosphatase PAP2 family protein n=1 Tax=Streptomyces niger TaxID=66373 RepID=UPI001F3064D5|nr:phosphatase PAP2 family protein [Streptomyces niger]